LEFAILEGGHGLLNNQGSILIGGRARDRRLGEASGDRSPKPRGRTLGHVDDFCRERCISPREVPYKRFDSAGIRIRDD
jgi:hypothetical protein